MPSNSAYLILKNVPHRDWSFPIDEKRKVLGRSPSADIRIPKWCRTVSRYHAEFWKDRRGMWIHDMGSTAGTNVNGVWVDHLTKAPLVIGDRIWLGGLEVEVVESVEKAAHLTRSDKTPKPYWDPKTPSGRNVLHRLSPAEIDVMLWLSRGYENDVEIGKVLRRSPYTVKTQITSIFQKMRLHSRAQLMCFLKRADEIG